MYIPICLINSFYPDTSLYVYIPLAASEDVVSLIENADQIKAKLPMAYETGDRPEIISWRTAETQIRPPLD